MSRATIVLVAGVLSMPLYASGWTLLSSRGDPENPLSVAYCEATTQIADNLTMVLYITPGTMRARHDLGMDTFKP